MKETTNRCHEANSKANISFKAVFTSGKESERDREWERERECDFYFLMQKWCTVHTLHPYTLRCIRFVLWNTYWHIIHTDILTYSHTYSHAYTCMHIYFTIFLFDALFFWLCFSLASSSSLFDALFALFVCLCLCLTVVACSALSLWPAAVSLLFLSLACSAKRAKLVYHTRQKYTYTQKHTHTYTETAAYSHLYIQRAHYCLFARTHWPHEQLVS